jgi:hypothetical protein
MKRRLIIIALVIGLINAGGWSVLSAYAAHSKSQANHLQIRTPHVRPLTNPKPFSKSHNVRKKSNSKTATKNRSDSENENLPGGGHADTNGENVDHQFEGIE